jgi:NAD-specific glutamate dehydrogenase
VKEHNINKYKGVLDMSNGIKKSYRWEKLAKSMIENDIRVNEKEIILHILEECNSISYYSIHKKNS